MTRRLGARAGEAYAFHLLGDIASAAGEASAETKLQQVAAQPRRQP